MCFGETAFAEETVDEHIQRSEVEAVLLRLTETVGNSHQFPDHIAPCPKVEQGLRPEHHVPAGLICPKTGQKSGE